MQPRTTFLVVWSLVAVLAAGAAPRLAAQTGTIRCESKGNGRDQCAIDHGARVELTRHLSATPCRENSNWGVGQGFIWVSNGCRAEFSVTSVAYAPPSQVYGQANPNQLRACRTEAKRRLGGYSYAQIRADPVSRQGDVARIRWLAGDAGGMCVVTASGRILEFTMRGDDEAGGGWGTTGTRLTCESKSAEREECRIPRDARVRLVRQLSQNACRPNDTYGTGDGYVWVAKGCRAEFEVFRREIRPTPGAPGQGRPDRPAGPGGVGGPAQPTTITCRSVGNIQIKCPIPAGASVRLARQLTQYPCRPNQSYGTGPDYLWVSKGCGGEFEVIPAGASAGNAGGTGLAERVTCESKGGERTECPMRSGGQVQLVRQLSTTACNRYSTWGTGNGVIWVTKGCRGEFEVR
jgi:hypothetical protein